MIAAVFCLLVFPAALSPASSKSDLTIIDAARNTESMPALIRQLADKRVVFIGEDHDRYDNHLNQLQIIRELNTNAPGHSAIGVEYIQRRFQPYLDAYIDKTISEPEFLRQTDYFERWGFDWRLYRDIFRYARDHHIPMVALNAERELTDEVDRTGLAALPVADRARLPQHIEDADASYRERLHKIFDEHPDQGNFDRFVEAQLVWDETMAESVANYLAAHPDKAMIVLAGEGHIALRSGIPARVSRRLPGIQTAVVLPADKPGDDLQGADYLLISPMLELPPSGKMGVTLNSTSEVSVKSVSANGAAAQAGLHAGDRIVAIDAEPVHSLADFRLALLDKKPGKHVRLRIQRGKEEMTVQLTLKP
jgi:uncharacterized iron-regulated protein